ncbi:MAG: hypothetical protein HGA47_03440 [Zoogloea sp.]|nr:hypothetical protein [Zoogloea sp.]
MFLQLFSDQSCHVAASIITHLAGDVRPSVFASQSYGAVVDGQVDVVKCDLWTCEIHDLFGIKIKNMSVDYKGTFYRTTITTPFSIENLPKPKPPKQPKHVLKQPSHDSKQQTEVQTPQKESKE